MKIASTGRGPKVASQTLPKTIEEAFEQQLARATVLPPRKEGVSLLGRRLDWFPQNPTSTGKRRDRD